MCDSWTLYNDREGEAIESNVRFELDCPLKEKTIFLCLLL